MSKLNIKFNNADYHIDESAFAPTKAELQNHLSSVMSGSGALIKLGDSSYNIDSTKLITATNDFVSYLGTIYGNGGKVIINGVEYAIDFAKLSDAIADMSTTLAALESDDNGNLQAGLYDENGVQLASWDELVNDYGLNVNIGSSADETNTAAYTASLLYVYNNNPELSSATQLIVPDVEITPCAGAFKNCTFLKNVEFHTTTDKFVSIGNETFYGCSDLENVLLPETLLSIGERAFYGCCTETKLRLTLPKNLREIGAYAFANSRLFTLVFSKGVTYIGANAFENTILANVNYKGTIEDWCNIVFDSSGSVIYTTPVYRENFFYCLDENNIQYEPTEFKIPNTVTKIGDFQFAGFGYVTKITLSENLTSIGKYAFSASKFENINIPNSVVDIGEGAFMDSLSLTNITLPEGLTSIAQYAFYECPSLTSITIPNNVTSIGSYAFYKCTSLVNIEIPNSVTSIEGHAFYGSTNLVSVTIPSSVTSIGGYAFNDCTNLTIYCEATSQPEGWDSNWNSSNCPVVWDYKNTIDHICINESTISKVAPTCTEYGHRIYTCNECGKEQKVYSQTILNHTYEDGKCIICNYPIASTGLKYNLLSDNTYSVTGITNFNLDSIVIPSFYNGKIVTDIGREAFQNRTGLTSITIPSSVTSIGNGAFGNVPGTIHLPNSLRTILTPFKVSDSTSITYNVYFHYSNTDEVLFDTSQAITQGSSKKTYTYNIYTDSTTLKDAFIAKVNSYTIVNMYHLDGTEWS